MRNKLLYKNVAFIWMIIVFLSGCSHTETTSPKSPTRLITILHTNDTHGHAWSSKDKDGKEWGGFAAQSHLINKIRSDVEAQGGITLTLSGGDINTGVAESDLFQAKPDLLAMNKMGYEAMALGNHEFDKGLPALQEQMKIANFPFLSANILYKSGTDKYFSLPFIIVEKSDLKFAIIGLSPGDLSSLVLPELVKPLNILDPLEAAQAIWETIEHSKPDVVIGLTHIGVIDANPTLINIPTTDDRKLAREFPMLDVIVGGHSHTLLPHGEQVNMTVIAQAGSHGKHLGRIDLQWDPASRKITSWKAQTIPILPTEGEDEALKQELDEFKKTAQKKLDVVVGKTAVYLDAEREHIRNRETNFGNLICDILKNKTKADIALYNSGGIRASIPKGIIRLRDIYESLPFGNTVVTANVTGTQLLEAIRSGIKFRQSTGSFPQVSGMKILVKSDDEVLVTVNGKHLKPEQTYRLVTNNFVLTGGDHYTALINSSQKLDTSMTVQQLVLEHFQGKKSVSPGIEGRIILEHQ